MYNNLANKYDDAMKCMSILKCCGIYQHIYDYLSKGPSTKKQQYVEYAMLINECSCNSQRAGLKCQIFLQVTPASSKWEQS